MRKTQKTNKLNVGALNVRGIAQQREREILIEDTKR